MLSFVLTISLYTFIGLGGKPSQFTEFETSYEFNGVEYSIKGYDPSTTGPHALFIFLAGTGLSYWEPAKDGPTYCNYLVSNGIVAAGVEYDNAEYPASCDAFIEKTQCIFSTSSSTSALSVLCGRSNVDCTKGIILAGFSQGSQLSLLAANYIDTVSTGYYISGVYAKGGGNAVTDGVSFETCLNIETMTITSEKIRSCVGELDAYFGANLNGVRQQQIAMTGADNCDSDATSCIQSDGSGWYIVTSADAQRTATHCYSYKGICGPALSVTYYNGCKLTCQWSLESNMEWLLQRIQL